MKKIKVLSLFDGMSCGQLALQRAGIGVDNYFASEVDKHAIKVTQANFPNTIQLGDVRNVQPLMDLPEIDLLIGGSPCQGFSFAGKQLNFEDPRSKLFFEFVRILEDCRPKYFLLENVRMKKSSQNIISKFLGVDPIEINSNLVSAQNRRRLYWTNIPGVVQPGDKKIFLKDILVRESGEFGEPDMSLVEKSDALMESYKRLNPEGFIDRNKKTVILEAKNGKKVHIDLLMEAPFSFYETRTEEGKAARRRIKQETGRDSTPRSKAFKMYKPLKDQKANCVVTVESPLDYVVDEHWNYRKLYPEELERLQVLPTGYTKRVSDSQARKMIGNGWTVDVIVHIFNSLKPLL